jgi:hypothetical protein
MSKKTTYLISFVLLLSLASGTLADLVVHWRLDDGSGTTAIDSSGNGYDGTFVGTPQWAEGYYGGGLQFTAEGQICLYSFDAAEPWPAGTVTFWIKANDVGQDNWSGLFSSHMPNSAGFQIDVNGANPGSYNFRPGNSVFGIVTTDWVHLALTWDGTSANFYYNGTLATSRTVTETNTTFNQFALGTNRNGVNTFMAVFDDLRVYNNALTEDEIQEAMKEVIMGLAEVPSPADGATDVPSDVVLSWTPGASADQHDVYFGTSFDDVDTATNLDPMGPDKVYRARQGVNSYAFPERLDFGQTYYWRVDEVNATATSDVIFKGNVWSFTIEPFAYVTENITATASSSDVGRGPENTVNGSGLDDSGLLHDKVGDGNMWLSSTTGPQPSWIEFEFDKVYKLHEMWVWNSNETLEPMVGIGFKDVVIEYSVNGRDYTPPLTNLPGRPVCPIMHTIQLLILVA